MVLVLRHVMGLTISNTVHSSIKCIKTWRKIKVGNSSTLNDYGASLESSLRYKCLIFTAVNITVTIFRKIIMSTSEFDGWGTWKFSDRSQEELKSLTDLFKCQSSRPIECKHLNSKAWRFILDKLKTEKPSELNNISTINVNETGNLCGSFEPNYLEPVLQKGDSNITSELNDEAVENLNSPGSGSLEPEVDGEDNETVKVALDICDFLKKEPMTGLSAKIQGKEVVKMLQAIKNGLPDEESVANLLLSVCPPMEENLLEQSRWAPALYQHIILPEILGRSAPVPRVLSSAISQLAASSPDACVQLLCMPLLLSPNVIVGPSDLMQPAIEVLMKITEESLPPLQKVSLFRAFHKEVLSQGRVTVQEELFPLLLTLAETEGTFSGADLEVLSNLIDWLDMCSQDHATSIKFTKYVVAVLKGMVLDVNSRKDGNINYLNAGEKVKLRNIVSQNKTFLKKIAEKSLKPLV